MPMAASWIAYQKSSGPKFLGWRFCCFLLELIACKIGPGPNEGHAHGGGIDLLSKTFGAEKFWVAILLAPIKTDLVQERHKPERCACPWRRHGLAIKIFRDRQVLDGDSVDSYKKLIACVICPKPERWACAWRRYGLAIKNFRDRKLVDGDSAGSYKN